MNTAASPHTLAVEFLRANSDAYEWLVARAIEARGRGQIYRALDLGAGAATFAGLHHPGRFSDGALDNLLLSIGENLPAGAREAESYLASHGCSGDRRRVLHVIASFALGGHIPLVKRWIATDASSRHTVLLLNPTGESAERCRDTFAQLNCQVIVLAPGDALRRAATLRHHATNIADIVVWHIISPEIVPVLAFAKPGGPPVVAVDHADHMYWTGGVVADLLVTLRSIGKELTSARRCNARCVVLPIPLLDAEPIAGGTTWRKRHGFTAEDVLLLTVGRGIKFRPSGQFDFVATAGRLLDKLPNAHLVIVGETLEGLRPYLQDNPHPRIRFAGPLDGPAIDEIRAQVDLYFESFPYGSQTALLEAALAGLPVVRALAPICPLLVASDDSFDGVLPVFELESEYLESAAELMRSRVKRQNLGAELRRRVTAQHCGAGWLGRLHEIYAICLRGDHHPRPSPVRHCSLDHVDAGLSLWSAVANGRDTRPHAFAQERDAALLHRAYVARYVGNYGLACRAALRATLLSPFSIRAQRALGIAALGPLGPLLRQGWNAVRRNGVVAT